MSAQRKPAPHLRLVTHEGEVAPPAPLANRELGMIRSGRLEGCFVVPQHWACTASLLENGRPSNLMLFMWVSAFMQVEPVPDDEAPETVEGEPVRYRAMATADDFNEAVNALRILAGWTGTRAKKWLGERVRDGLIRISGADR